MKVNDAIRKMMEARSMRAPDLGAKLGVSPQAVHHYINGQKVGGRLRPTSVTVDTALEIAAALDYELALVPATRGDRLPEGTLRIDERLTEKRASRKGGAPR